jgi:hypothetical protein
VLVGHRQRIAVDAIAGPEVALEVCSPQVVGVVRRRRHHTGVRVVPEPSALLDQAAPRQKVTRRARSRQVQRRVTPLQPMQNLVRPPARVLPAHAADRLRHGGRDPVGTFVGSPAPFAQALGALPLVTLDPLVPRLPADPVPLAQLHHRVQVPLPVRDEPHTLAHGCRLRPRHAHLLVSSLCGVTHVPGQMCYLCTRFVPPLTLGRAPSFVERQAFAHQATGDTSHSLE